MKKGIDRFKLFYFNIVFYKDIIDSSRIIFEIIRFLNPKRSTEIINYYALKLDGMAIKVSKQNEVSPDSDSESPAQTDITSMSGLTSFCV